MSRVAKAAVERPSVEEIYRADRPWRTLLALYRPEQRSVIFATILYLFKASPLWILPVVTANIIDLLASPRPDGEKWIWINAAVGSVSILQNVPSAMLFVDHLSRAVRNVEIRLRSALVRRLQMLSISYHNSASTAALQTKVLRDVESIEQLSRQIIDTGLLATVSILVSLGVTAWRMPLFLPVFLLFIPMVAVIRRTMTGRLQQHNEALRIQLERMSAGVLGMIQMIPVTRAHAAEAAEIERVENQLGNVRNAGRKFDRLAGLFGAVAWVIFMMFNIGCLAIGSWLSYKKIVPLTAGDIVLMTGYLNTILSAVMQLNAMLPLITRGFDGLRSIGEVLESPDLEENRGKRVLTSVDGCFRFENVSFHYGDPSSGPLPALDGIDLEVAAGEAIGIVGESGSGKSTLASLIIGFHRPTAGRIFLDGTEMNAIDLRSFRRQLAIVSQQTLLFDGTLRENITYGTPNVSDRKLTSAIEAANAAEFIRDLPEGCDTEIGARGTQLSGGQRQRIAIARALLREPRVLILDEATSSLDSANEAVVQEALERLMLGRTTFIIAHRLATLRRVDRIIVLEKGRMVESGAPAILAAGEIGHFARLRKLQATTS